MALGSGLKAKAEKSSRIQSGADPRKEENESVKIMKNTAYLMRAVHLRIELFASLCKQLC
jgi:hypothetical protein